MIHRSISIETDIRPWGEYHVLLDEPTIKVKKIVVNPGQRLSYQYHHQRSELWVVSSGKLTVILDDQKHVLSYGDRIEIPVGVKHRAWNETGEIAEFIEIQTGTYFGEDDIVRLSDDYSRT